MTENNYEWFGLFSDDLKASESGCPLPRYNAFLLFHDADIQSAYTVVQKLETDYKLKVPSILLSIKYNLSF